MSKNQTIAKKEKLFQMTPLHDRCHFSKVQVDFTAPVNVRRPIEINVPIYLNDGKSFTPGFVLHSDKTYYLSNINYEKTKFENKIMQALQFHHSLQNDSKSDQELLAKEPSSCFCQICKIIFTSYHDHIHSPLHLSMLEEKNQHQFFNQMLEMMRESIKPPKRKNIRKRKEKKPKTATVESLQTRNLKKKRTNQSIKTTTHSLSTNQSHQNPY